VSAAGDRYDYLGDGLIEEMTTELGCNDHRIGRLRPEHFAVIARTSAMQFDDLEERRAKVAGSRRGLSRIGASGGPCRADSQC
jgi:hypothetical protein